MPKNTSKEKNKPSNRTENRYLSYSLYLLFVIFLIFLNISRIGGEDDFFWHIASGRYIVETKSVPSTDVFGYATSGQEWIPFEWGWDVITFLIFNLWGFTGIYIFKIFIAVATFILLSKLLDKFSDSVSLKIFFLMIFSWVMSFRFSLRPHLISLFFISLIIYLLVSYRYFNRANYKSLYYLPLIFLIWGNLHLGVIAGVIFFGVFVIGEILTYYFPKRFSSKYFNALNKKELLRLAVLFIISIITLLINPNHIHTYQYAYVLTHSKFIYELGEFKSPFDPMYNSSISEILYKIFLVLGIFIIYYSYKKKDIFAFLITIAFILYSIKATRFTGDYNIIAVLFIFISIISLSGNKFKESLKYNYAPKVIIGVILLFQLINIPNDKLFNDYLKYYRKWGTGTDRNFASNRVFDFIRDNKINEIGNHVFNSYTCGGLFIWEFPQSKNFIDSRFINDEIFSEYDNIFYCKPGFKEKINNYNIDYFTLFIPGMIDNPQILGRNIVGYLSTTSSEWKLVYWDDLSFVFVKNIPKFEPIISKYEYKYVTPVNFVFQKKLIDKAFIDDKDKVIKEIRRKLSEEPDGYIDNVISSTYKVR